MGGGPLLLDPEGDAGWAQLVGVLGAFFLAAGPGVLSRGGGGVLITREGGLLGGCLRCTGKCIHLLSLRNVGCAAAPTESFSNKNFPHDLLLKMLSAWGGGGRVESHTLGHSIGGGGGVVLSHIRWGTASGGGGRVESHTLGHSIAVALFHPLESRQPHAIPTPGGSRSDGPPPHRNPFFKGFGPALGTLPLISERPKMCHISGPPGLLLKAGTGFPLAGLAPTYRYFSESKNREHCAGVGNSNTHVQTCH